MRSAVLGKSVGEEKGGRRKGKEEKRVVRTRDQRQRRQDRESAPSLFTITRDSHPPFRLPPPPARPSAKHSTSLSLRERKHARFCPAPVLGRRRRPLLLGVRPPGRCREAARFGRRCCREVCACCCLCFDADRSRRRSPRRQVRRGNASCFCIFARLSTASRRRASSDATLL